MKTRIIEAVHGLKTAGNWGKFLVGIHDEEEWAVQSALAAEYPTWGGSLLQQIGANPQSVWVLDLQTREGASFTPGGSPPYDLQKHKIWVCPMFEPFLCWLYLQPYMRASPPDIEQLPAFVELPDAEFAMSGYRREGRG